MQSNNLLLVPFRKSVPISLSNTIRKYIGIKYDQHEIAFKDDLQSIDNLRKDAINVQEPHISGVFKLQKYAAQLVFLSSKFPTDLGVEFTWWPCLRHSNHAQNADNIKVELANILFNLAALYSQLALSSNRASSDGLKNAASNFCLAAGVISHLKTNITPELRSSPPEDMDDLTLESLENLMLAQGQECYWQKAVKDGLRDASIAKLAAKVSDLYSEAGDWALKSDSISSEWIHHINAKHHHFASAAQFRAACDCLEKRKYGEEVARLRDSLNCVNEAMKESRYINKAVLGDLSGLKNRVSEDLKRAEKDNDTIYLIPEPSKSELKTLDRASMVGPKIPKEVSHSQEMLGAEGSEFGRPLFAKLVPYSVHVAASIYADRRDRLVNNTIIAELEALTQSIHETLSNLNLPGSLQALEKPLGLPPGLASHAEEIRQANGVQRLHNTIKDTEKLKASNRNLYQEGVDLLRTEAGEDEAARRKFGTDRWPRAASKEALPKLYSQVNDIDGYLKQADNSDRMVQTRLRENETLIRLLGGTDRDLEDYVPSSRRATMTAKVEKEANVLRSTLNEVNRLESRRRKKVEALRTKAKEDDVNSDLLTEAARLEREYPMHPVAASQFEGLFDTRLKKYDIDQQDLKSEENEQDRLAKRVNDANTNFQLARKGDSSSKEREQALQNLENAYISYKEILRNLETGRKFYNDLSAITTRFRDECRNFVYARRTEAQTLEADVSTAMAGMQLQQTTQQNLMNQKQQQQQQQAAPPARMVNEPMPAPMPQRPNASQAPPAVVNTVQSPPAGTTTWQEGMPILFGNQQASSGATKR